MRDEIIVGKYLQVGVSRFYVGDRVKVVSILGDSYIGKLTSIHDEGILVTDGWGITINYNRIKRINHVRLGD